MPSPVGIYKKVGISINNKPVYHNIIDDYFIYNQKLDEDAEDENSWIVSFMQIHIIICKFNVEFSII